MNKAALKYIVSALTASAIFTACGDSSDIGSSLVENETEVVMATEFNLSGRTIVNPKVQSRTTTQVLGRINAKGYGNFQSDFITQFMPSSKIDTENLSEENIDSLKLLCYVPIGSCIGDSIAPMGLEVYRLNKQLPSPIYSNESPDEYYNPNDLLGTKIYACNALGAPDSIKALSYRTIDVHMPVSLAKELYNLYKTTPSAYALPTTFAKHFPGIYVKNSYGNGRVVEITNTIMRLYYHTTSTDSVGAEVITRYEGNYYAVSPEIIINNNLKYEMDSELQQRIDEGENIVVAPVGRDIEIEFPVKEIIDYYQANRGTLSVINSLTMDISADSIANDYGITPPDYLLLVLSKDKDNFFLGNELNNDVTSFYAGYDSTNNRYRFTLRPYILEMLTKDEVKPEDYTFTITPVSIESESNSSDYYYGSTTTYVSAINPYVGAPTMVKLNLDKTEISLTFSKQTLK